ncbi:hypothetical protein AB0945_35070 [Streptomyces sp. NPDC005474]|uniref:DUF7848 domain-containing protein n=1 Tax=Streptomyces sp. NPDC005474 TaxID=3154878 RepID=UPI0034518510
MSRVIMKYVPHTITHVPDSGVTFEVLCAASDCGAESGPQDEQDTAQLWALRHTGRTDHDLFRRVVTDHAKVTRTE